MRINIGIDASRNRSGGAITHIIGILENFDVSLLSEISEVHIWSYQSLLDQIPNRIWLKKHSPRSLSGSVAEQLAWQRFELAKEANRIGINILLNCDAGTVCRFQPSVTISRDLLSYEKSEFDRYKFGLFKLRLIMLRYIQNYSLSRSFGVIFLTDYARIKIEEYIGSIREYAIIPHGVDPSFRISRVIKKRSSLNDGQPIRCVYVSNIGLYKHQSDVAYGIATLRDKGYNIHCDFIGNKATTYYEDLQIILEERIKNSDQFLHTVGPVEHKKLPEYLKDKDIFIFASGCENMPNILIEGMCTGLPIACSNQGPMRSILKDGGVYFDPSNKNSIAACLEKIINDDELRNEISRKSLMLSEEYSWQHCSFETFQYLCKVAALGNSRAVER